MSLKSFANCSRERLVFLQGFSHIVPTQTLPGHPLTRENWYLSPKDRENNVVRSACANKFFNRLLTIVERDATCSPQEFTNIVKTQP